MSMTRRCLLALAAGLAAAQAVPALADKLPAGKALHLVVPYAAGGTTDVLARQLAAHLGEVLGQPVVVDNKPGAAGTIAGQYVASQAPDGLTLLVGGIEMATVPSLVSQKTFVPTRDLAGVAGVSVGPLVLLVNPQKTSAKTLAELIAQAKAQPGAMTFASAGNGNVTHLFGEIFKRSAKLDLRHVPYRGAAPALTDLAGGQVTMMMAGTASVRQFVANGTLHALAVTGKDAAMAGVPGVPTFAEAGLPMPETDGGAWIGLFAPKATPQDAIAQLNDAVGKVLASPELKAQFANIGLAPEPMPAQALQAHLAAQTQVWGQIITLAGIRVD
jgi:tripartite-type tricarboxylate transporter receptor subunit TctC